MSESVTSGEQVLYPSFTQSMGSIALRVLKSEGVVGQLRQQYLDNIARDPNNLIVQIGANDGMFDDPLYDFLQEHPETQALLVEPQEQPFERLSRLHEASPKINCVQKAIATNADSIELWSLAMGDGTNPLGKAVARKDPSTLSQVMSYRPLKRLAGYSVEAETVPAAPLDEVLDEAGINASAITAFFTDTEGCDTDVVDQLLNYGARPDMIQYEHRWASKEDVIAANERLADAGYSLNWSYRDVLAVQAT